MHIDIVTESGLPEGSAAIDRPDVVDWFRWTFDRGRSDAYYALCQEGSRHVIVRLSDGLDYSEGEQDVLDNPDATPEDINAIQCAAVNRIVGPGRRAIWVR